MDESLAIAKIAWEVGTAVAGSTAGGRRAVERALRESASLQGLGESRLIRSAIAAAVEDTSRDPSDVPLVSPRLSPSALSRVIEAAVLGPREVLAGATTPGAHREELDRLWASGGRDACVAAIARARVRTRRATVLKFAGLALFIGMIIFVAQDLMRSADKQRRLQDEAERYSVPLEAIGPAIPEDGAAP